MRYLVILLSLIAVTAPVAADPAADLQDLFEREWAFRMAEDPESASYNGIDRYADRLTRMSAADLERRDAFWREIQQEANALSCNDLSRGDCIDLRMFRRQVDRFVRAHELGLDLVPFSNDWGFWSRWARLPATTAFRDGENYEDYLARLEMLPTVMDEYIALMRQGIERGITQPRVIMPGVMSTVEAHVVDAVEDSRFFSPFNAWPDGVAPERRQALTERARTAIGDGVIPAYASLLTFFEDEYLPAARSDLGASSLPDGEAVYAEQIRWYVTRDMSAEEIHRIGREEVARIRGEMDEIIAEVGFEGSFAEFIDFLRTDPQFYARTPKELLERAAYVAKKADGKLPGFFGRLPRQPYGIEPVPADLAPHFTTGRAVPAPIGSDRAGFYWVNTFNLSQRPLYAIPALTVHEAAPGHLFQGALAREMETQPPFRRFDYISAYGEGWGLYTEKLGVEMDIYETPYEHFGRLSYEIWRACRLVIDTGIHAMDWSREQAQEYLASNSALSLHNVTTEVDRYISWPGQALSYKLGELTIWQLRREAERTLGADFDIKAFHDHLLGLGSVPLDVLQDEMRYWIGEQSGRA